MNTEKQLTTVPGFALSADLEHLAESISRSTIIPQEFRGNVANCIIALEMAHRINAGVLAVMQSMYVVHGKPSWSGQFVIGAINASRRFSPLRFTFNAQKTECYAHAEDHDGNHLVGPTVSIDMAKKEGWWDRNPKWKNMTELMLTYRSGTFFGRIYTPDLLMGMRETYEVVEAEATEIKAAVFPSVVPSTTEPPSGGEAVKPTESNPSPSAPPPAKKTPKKKAPPLKVLSPYQAKSERPSIEDRPYERRLLQRLTAGGYTASQFMMLATRNKWALQDELAFVPEEHIANWLEDDNWTIIQEQLEAMPPEVGRI